MSLPISGFMPIPLAMMIPFMATQSMVMGDAFGRSFQYGKRKISAMSNEEFNATSMNEQAEDMYKTYKLIIPSLQQSIKDSTELQKFIIASLLDMPRDLLASFFGAVTQQSQIDANSAAQQAGTKFQPPTQPTTTDRRARGVTTTTSVKVNQKLKKHIEGQIAKLKRNGKDIERAITVLIGKYSRKRVKPPSYIPDLTRLRKVVVNYKSEVIRQQGYLANVNRGQNPY